MTAVPADGAPLPSSMRRGTGSCDGTAGPDRGPWNDAWPAVHPLDLTALKSSLGSTG